MTQANPFAIPAAPLTGAALIARLTDVHNAFVSLHKGASRPSYAVAGTMWINDTTATAWLLNMYTGSADITLATFNSSTGKLILANGDVTGHGNSDYSILASDSVVYINAAFSAARTWTLPAASAYPTGRQLTILDTQGTVTPTNKLTIARSGSDLINGQTSYVLIAGFASLTLQSTGSAWTIVARLPKAAPKFHVHRNGTNQTGLTGGTNNVLICTTEDVDSENWHDTSTGKFTPQIAGWYHIYVCARTYQGTAGETCQTTCRFNGSTFKFSGAYFATMTATGGWMSQNQALIHFNGTTDYVECLVYVPVGSTLIIGTADQTFFGGYLVSQD